MRASPGRRRETQERARLSQPGEARVRPGAHSGGILPRFSLRTQSRSRLHGRRRAEAAESRGGLVISPDFPLELIGFFPAKHLIHYLVLKMKIFRNFVLDNCILVFDAEQVYSKLQATNLKNKEVKANPKPQTLEKN